MHKSDYVYPLNDRFHLLSNAGGKRALTSNMCVCVCVVTAPVIVSMN